MRDITIIILFIAMFVGSIISGWIGFENGKNTNQETIDLLNSQIDSMKGHRKWKI
jgi:membrane protein DedA with SNARE-associated domain